LQILSIKPFCRFCGCILRSYARDSISYDHIRPATNGPPIP
jgi:hypothetical protein